MIGQELKSRLQRRQRGSALLLVLGMGALLCVVTLAGMRSLSSTLKATAIARDEIQLEEAARSGLDILATDLSRLGDDAPYSGSLSLPLDGGHIDLNFSSEAGRVNIALAKEGLISLVLQSSGLAPDQALVQAKAIAAKRHKRATGTTSKKSDLANEIENEGEQAQTQLTSPYQLLHVPGMTSDRFALIQDKLTSCSGSATLDPLLADESMLKTLFAGDLAATRSYEKWRSQAQSITPEAAIQPFPQDIQPFLKVSDGSPKALGLHMTVKVGRLERRFAARLCAETHSEIGYIVDEWRVLH